MFISIDDLRDKRSRFGNLPLPANIVRVRTRMKKHRHSADTREMHFSVGSEIIEEMGLAGAFDKGPIRAQLLFDAESKRIMIRHVENGGLSWKAASQFAHTFRAIWAPGAPSSASQGTDLKPYTVGSGSVILDASAMDWGKEFRFWAAKESKSGGSFLNELLED